VGIEAEFPGTGRSVSRARALVVDALWQHGLNRLAAVASVVTSELATNAVCHARTSFRLTVHPIPRGVVIEVRMPQPVDRGPHEFAGHGLTLVAALADEWGVRREGGGKCVWFALSEVEPAGR
jgi:anti-sigma regulatory factor (Ser/Thr protein kinase)